MSKIEKTLELNITHELLSLADSFWWYLQPISLKRYWRPVWRFPLIQPPKSFATGLHINLEGKKGGGYDVCINSPSNFQGGSPRLLFMQFKAGKNCDGVTNNDKSDFSITKSNPNKHIEFDINSNNAKIKQHQLLHELASTLGKKDAAVYVFPQFIDEVSMASHIGKLCLKTLFISINDLEDKAIAVSKTLLDGKAHKFRLSYDSLFKSEVNFFFFFFGIPANSGGILGEIFAIRIYRALCMLKDVQTDNSPIYKAHLKQALIRHIASIAYHFSISGNQLETVIEAYYEDESELVYDMIYEYKGQYSNIEGNEYGRFIFLGIFQTIVKYLIWIDELYYFDKKTNILEPPSNFLIELPKEGFRIDFSDKPYGISDFEDLTYQLF